MAKPWSLCLFCSTSVYGSVYIDIWLVKGVFRLRYVQLRRAAVSALSALSDRDLAEHLSSSQIRLIVASQTIRISQV